MGAASWIWANKEWLFSGAGLLVGVAALKWFLRRRQQHQDASGFAEPEQMFVGNPPAPARIFWLWNVLEKIPPFQGMARRRIYTEQEIGRRIRVWIRSEGNGMDFYKNGEDGSVRVWLDVVNLNPFPLVIDRITGDVTVAGSAIAQINIIDRHKIPPLDWQDVYFQSPLTPTQVSAIAFQLKHRPDATAGLSVRIYLESEIRELTLFRQPASGNCQFPNFQL